MKMKNDFSRQIQTILKYSREEALRMKSDFINTEHILLGILKDDKNSLIQRLLNELDCNPTLLKSKIENAIKPLPFAIDMDDMPLTKRAENVLKRAWIEAGSSNSLRIEAEHLFLALLQEKDGLAATILSKFKIDYKSTKKALQDLRTSETEQDTNFNAVALRQYGIELTEEAKMNRLDPVIGREEEIERLLQILCRKKKNNPLIIGEPGIGKTSLVEGLADRIVRKKVPPDVMNSKIFSLDLTSIASGAALRGQLEEKLKQIIEKLLQAKNAFLYIDEIHNIVNVGGNGNGNSLSLANLLKPLLADGRLRVIGTTTYDDYRRIMERDRALIRRFQNIYLNPPGIKEAILILNGIKSQYEKYHGVKYSNDAMHAAATLSDRYLSERFLPDKAIDLLDEAGALVQLTRSEIKQDEFTGESSYEENYFAGNRDFGREENSRYSHFSSKHQSTHTLNFKSRKNEAAVVKKQDIALVLQNMTGISMEKISSSETKKLLEMENRLKKVVFGHDAVIRQVSSSLKRAKAGFKDPAKPIGSFLFVGPTGIGKTKLAKELASYLFGNEQAIIKIDMSEYMERFSVSRLIGAPPGYVGYERGGELTEKVRRHPYSIILLDNIDKAHADLLNILLQILDNGTLTDGVGRNVDFRNTIIILTMHFDPSEKRTIGFRNSSPELTTGKKHIAKLMAPELVNRIDEILEFKYFSAQSIRKIVKEELMRISRNLAESGYIVKIADEVLIFLEKRVNDNAGAREIKSIVRKSVEDTLASAILERKPETGKQVCMEVFDDEIVISFRKT
ncbi:AAA domain-containing protein [candidate division KSB1 bacterium]|nr:AAA domain-containing protein [candidate division KSB1 bacterium]